MKGIVEIYGITPDGDKDLVFKKPNLAVVGFAENIVDVLSTPSSIKYPLESNTNILDASNYEIQAFSMSKQKDNFRKHQHTYETVNLLHNSTLAPSDAGEFGYWSGVNITSSFGSVQGPTVDSSGTLISASTSGGYFYQSIGFNGANTAEFSNPYFSATDFTFSVDIKLNKDDPPVGVTTTNDYSGYSVIRLGTGGGYTANTGIRWDLSGVPHLHNNSYTYWDGGIRSLGSDWYRVFVQALNRVNTANRLTPVSAVIYPSIGDDGTIDSNLPPTPAAAGSIYISRPQLELGSVPTSYINTQDLSASRDDRLSYSLLNATEPYGTEIVDEYAGVTIVNKYVYQVVQDSGYKSLSSVYGSNINDKGVSAYLPETSSVKRVHYLDRELTSEARTPVEDALGIEFIQGQIPAAIGLGSNLSLSSLRSDWTYTVDSPFLGRHVAYLGAHPDTVGTPANSCYISYVSSYDITGLDNPLIVYPISVGVAEEGIDRYGFWTLSGNGINLSSGPTNLVSRFYKSTQPGFETDAEVSYIVTIDNQPKNEDPGIPGEDEELNAQRDSPLLNIFGGVDTLGLWGLDIKAMRDYNIANNPPYTEATDSGSMLTEPIRKYKLFNKINLSDNIVKCEGLGFGRGLIGYYKAFELRWRLSFK